MSSQPTRSNPFANLEDESLDDFQPKPTSAPASRPSGPQLTPQVPSTPSRAEERAQLTKLAEQSGFGINNYQEKPLPARLDSGPVDTFLKTMRIQVADWNKFQRWCHENKHTHWKGFQILVESLPKKST